MGITILEKEPKKILGYQPTVLLALSFTTIMWGSSFAVAKLALAQMAPLSLATLRFLVAGIFFVLVLYFVPEKKIAKEDWLQLTFLSFIGVASYFYVQYTGVSLTTASNASLMIATAPIFTAIFSVWLLKEKFSWLKGVGVLVSFLGVFLVISNGKISTLFNSGYFLGNIVLIFNASCWAIFSILGKRMMRKYKPLVVTAYLNIIGGILLVPFGVGSGLLEQAPKVDFIGWWAVIFLALFCSVGGYFAWYYALSKTDATKTAVFIYIQPLVTVVVASILLGEQITLFTICGTVLILSGVYLTSRG